MNKSKMIRVALLGAAFMGLTVVLNAWLGHKRVYVHSDASPDYLTQRSPGKPESYYFFKGMYFGGRTVNNSLQKVEFIDIARGLAPHLAKQDYWPAQSEESCDLLLVVSWGTTTVSPLEDIYLDLNNNGNYNDYFITSYFYDNRYSHEAIDSSRLIGFYPYMKWNRYDYMPHMRNEDFLLRGALDTERYFMIVTAFDFQSLLKDKRWNRVWSTRFSMRSPGTNFYRAHLALSKAAGAYYGKDLEKLGKERANFDPVIAEVEMGEIEVLETIDVPKRRGFMQSIRMQESRR